MPYLSFNGKTAKWIRSDLCQVSSTCTQAHKLIYFLILFEDLNFPITFLHLRILFYGFPCNPFHPFSLWFNSIIAHVLLQLCSLVQLCLPFFFVYSSTFCLANIWVYHSACNPQLRSSYWLQMIESSAHGDDYDGVIFSQLVRILLKFGMWNNIVHFSPYRTVLLSFL